MSKEQVNRAISPKQRTKRFKVYSGKVVFSDSRDEFVVESENQIRPVHSRFAFRLAPGDKVLVHELASVSKAASPYIESSLIEELTSEPLSESKSVSIAELLNNSSPPSRVSLTAKIESMANENGCFNLKLTSEDVEFGASVPEGDKSIDKLGVRVGDVVSLISSTISC